MYMHNYNSYHMTTKSNATPKMPWIPDLEVNARISTVEYGTHFLIKACD